MTELISPQSVLETFDLTSPTSLRRVCLSQTTHFPILKSPLASLRTPLFFRERVSISSCACACDVSLTRPRPSHSLVREAIDPFNQSSDEELNDILRRVHLIPRSSSAFPSGTPSRTPSSTNLTAAHTGASLPQGTSLAGTTLVEEPATNVRITLDSKVSASGLNFSQVSAVHPSS